jgi:hypothetical protein
MSCISRVLFWRDSVAPGVVKSGIAEPTGSLGVDGFIGACFLGSCVRGRSIVPKVMFMP